MPPDNSNRLTMCCEAEQINGPRLRPVIEFEFDEIVDDHVSMWVRLRIENSVYRTGRWFYWWNIQDFADGLARLHSELKGACSLSDWDGEEVLCLSMLDPVRGRIGVAGQLNQYVFADRVIGNGDFVFPQMFGDRAGVVVSFHGLVTDQSYLPALISGFHFFLNTSGISHRRFWS